MTRWPCLLLLLLLVAAANIHYANGAVIVGGGGVDRPKYFKKTVLTVGYLTAIKGELKDKQGLAISGALTMALAEINNDPHVLPNVTLALRWNDTRGDTVLATRAITEMLCDGVATFFGPEGPCHVEAIVSQSRNIPMISYKCSDYMASSIPTFARTEPPDTQVTKSVISLLNYYGWKKFSIIHEELWSTVAKSLKEQAEKKKMIINHSEKVIDNHKCCENDMICCRSGYWYQLIQNTMNRTRVYVFLGTPTALVDMMASMDTVQLFAKGEYMVIYVDMMTYSPREAQKYLWKTDQLNKLSSCHEVENFEKRARSLLVVVSTPPTENYENFTAKVREYNTKEPFNFLMPNIFNVNNYIKFVSIYAAYLYDSVKLYAWALDKLLRQETQPLTDEIIFDVASNGARIIETIIKNRTYKSITGATIKIDENGDSEGNFSVLSLKPYTLSNRENFSCNLHMVPVGFFQQGDDFPEYKIINSSVRVDWPGPEKPADQPICGFMNELCPKDESHITSMVAAGVLALILFCAGVITMSIYRKWKIELEIEGLLWKIDPSEIKGYFGNDIVSSPSKLSLVSAQSYGSRCSNQVFTTTGRFRGVVIRIKELKFARKKDISRDIMKEMRLLREIRHDNINSFIGAVVEPMRTLLVTDYCAKGSLYDIIENEDIKLDDLFIASLVHDLIKGMIYIHDSALNFHGNLKSSNCVVTSRWMLQVTDFGVHDLRHCAESESIGEHQYYRSQFWKAPELLRNPNVYGTQKADVYAFAIILYEVIGRKGPYGQIGLEPKEIVELVKREPLIDEEPFRPEISCILDSGNCADYIINCIKESWDENPEVRPEFSLIRSRLKKMRGGKSKNIMDQMMEMMEKYADNLEEIVSDRTRLLCEEKKKTEDLLHRMLPLSVAENLTKGRGVEPVSYNSVTIYFSDIVGFTAMSAESTPLQVVNFLNDLYTVFDRIIKGYDVYKVETIGDAYMVVSGLPESNGDSHVGEIASMSLDLLHAVRQHKIAHRPNEVLKLRIGMHTGPVVAGVVGLTMPRYCLFGDTVNTASRMESNGEALKIHISAQCKEALDRIGGYITESRGLIPLKGKGEVVTYWLIGATESAVQRREFDLGDLPPPLFCRPRRSPKFNCDSRQPSYIGAPYFGGGGGSRRQSTAPRGDIDSTHSLQGSLYAIGGGHRGNSGGGGSLGGGGAGCGVGGGSITGGGGGACTTIVARDSPRPPLRKFERSPLYLYEDLRSTIEQPELEYNEFTRKPLAMVKPRQILSSMIPPNGIAMLYADEQLLPSNNSTNNSYNNNINNNNNNGLRICKSLEMFPSQLRKRNTILDITTVKKPLIKCSKSSSRSLDMTGLSLISQHPNNCINEPINNNIINNNNNNIINSQSNNNNNNNNNNHSNNNINNNNNNNNNINNNNSKRVSYKHLTNYNNNINFNNDNNNNNNVSNSDNSNTNNVNTINNNNNNRNNYNCNGMIGNEDSNCPLLHRQRSLNNPHDEFLSHSKRWRSLETISDVDGRYESQNRDGGNIGDDEGSRRRRGGGGGHGDGTGGGALSRGSIRSWFVNFFQGAGFKSSDASLRKVGNLQTTGNTACRGINFEELSPSGPEHESIV